MSLNEPTNQRTNESQLDVLETEFESLFVAPYATHRWETRRARSHWVELEGWQDSFAGPLLKVVESGGCDYVYSRNDSYFAGVVDPATLRSRLLGWHDNLVHGVSRFVPDDLAEATDLAYMRAITERMRCLIELACEVEQGRWQRSHVSAK